MKRFVGALLVAGVLLTAEVGAAARPTSAVPTVGSTITTRQLAVTLRAYRQTVAAPGAIDVKVCNRTNLSQPVRRTQFFLQTPDGHLVLPDDSIEAPRPQLATAPLPARRCVRGWLGYQLPASSRATHVVFQAGAMFTATLHTWDLPPA